MDYPWAVPGAKVVCIIADWDMSEVVDPAGRLRFPVKGEVYTIRDVVSFGGDVAIWLSEIRNPVSEAGSGAGREIAWHIAHFRPLITQSQDVAKFTHLLNTAPHELIEADA